MASNLSDIAKISMMTRRMCSAFSSRLSAGNAVESFFNLIRVIDGVGSIFYADVSGDAFMSAEPGHFRRVSGNVLDVSGILSVHPDREYLDVSELFPASAPYSLPVGRDSSRIFLLRADKTAVGVVCVEMSGVPGWTAEAGEYMRGTGTIFAVSAESSMDARRLSEERMRLEHVLDGLDALVYVTDIKTNEILFINNAMKSTFGLENTTGGRCWQVFQAGMSAECSFCPVHNLRSIDDPPIVWHEHNTKTGRHYRNTDRLIRWIDNKIVHIQHSVDITDEKITRETLDKTQLTLETVFNAVPSAIFWKSRDGKFEGANRQFLSLIKLSAEELIGRSDEEILPPEDSGKFTDEDNIIFSGECDGLSFERKIGEKVWTVQKKVPVRSASGNVISVLGIVDDISRQKLTELMLMEKQALLEEAIEEAKAASQAKSVFLSRMSHEIRTPMNAIIGMTKIASDSADMVRIKSSLQKITVASNQLLDIINDVLDMSKIEAGKLTFVTEDFNFEQTLINLADILLVKSDEKHQTVNFILDGNIPGMLRGDPLRLSQVITNLLSNAIKFTPQYGKIVLKARLTEDTGDSVRVEFSVQDSGIGITEEQKSRLFHAFEQADGSISRNFGGTGLGLVICKSIVEMMGGGIDVESDGKSYSRFVFDVVLQKAVEGEPEPPVSHDFEMARVLFIDDDEDTREYFKHIAERIGLTATVVESGARGVELMKRQPFDVAFVDFIMPGMDGIQTVHTLRGINPGAKYILISCAVDFAEISDLAAAEGITRFISKPLFDSVILGALDRARDTKSLAAGADAQNFARFEGKRVLLVEDIEINREIVQEILSGTGILLDFAENGIAALEKVAQGRPYDLILMDIHMPKMNGYEASLAIRAMAEPWAAQVPIVAMTADVFAEDIQSCLNARMNGHMAKPIKTEELFGVLHRYLDK